MDPFQVFRLLTVRKIAREPDAVETLRQNVLQEHSDEVCTPDCKKLLSAAIGIILIAERHVSIGHFCDTAVGDRSAEGVARKITDRVAAAVKGFADEGDPVLCKQGIDESLPTRRIFQLLSKRKNEGAVIVELFECTQIFPAKHGGYDRFWKEEALVPGFHELPGGGKPSSGDADVDVRVKGKPLSPGVQNRKDSRLSPQKLSICAQSKKCILHALKLQIQEELWIRFDQRIKFMRHCKDDMEVGDALNQFGIAFQLPFFLKRGLTAGTGTVVAGNGVDNRITAVLTVTDVVSELTGLAVHDTGSCLTLICRQRRVEFQEIRVKAAEDLPDGVISRSHKDSSRSFRSRCRVQDRLPWKKGIYGPWLP